MSDKQPFKISTLKAYVSEDEDGTEGIIAMQRNGTWYPMICADQERFDQWYPEAQKIAKITGRAVKIVHFVTRIDLETIKPSDKLSALPSNN